MACLVVPVTWVLAALPSIAADPGEPPSRPSAPVQRTSYRVAAIGDSLTDVRVGGGRYMQLLQQRCPESRFDAYGVGGQRTDHMRWRLARDLFGEGFRSGPDRPPYTHVIILGGVNDLVASPRSYAHTDSIRSNLSVMWREAKARGLTVIALTVPPWTTPGPVRDRRIDATNRLNAWMVAQQREGHVDVVVDIHSRLLDDDAVSLQPQYRRYAKDFIHWNPRGHQVIADALYSEVFSDCR